MALKLVALFLALTALGALAARPRDIQLQCKDNTLVCWPHSYSIHEYADGFPDTCAVLKCEDNGEMQLSVKSPHHTHRVDFSARRYAEPTEAGYPALEIPECSTTFDETNFPNTIPIVIPISTGGIEVPEHVTDLNADYENIVNHNFPPVNNMVHDLNADYAALWEDWQEKNMGRSGHVRQASKQPGGIFKPAAGQCRPDIHGRDNLIIPGTEDKCFNRRRMIVKVTEYLGIPNSVVDLVTVHTLFLDCGSCITGPNDDEILPEVKYESTAQCQESSYRLAVAHSADKYDVEVSEAVHPNSDQLVGWQVAQLKYAQDEIVVNNAFTTVGLEIDGAWNGPESWQAPGPHSYLFSTDVVVDQGSNPSSLGLSAQVNYCYNSGAFPIGDFNKCSTPAC